MCKKLAVLVGVIGVFLFVGFKSGEIGMNKYDWLASECALEKYPMEILKGDLVYKNGKSLYVPSGKTICNGMGIGLSTHVVGADKKPLPVKLYIHWFSYVEDKFYEGTFDLPIEKIKALFKEGIESPSDGKKITYDKIIVGLAPEGEISVFLNAHAVVLEVASFKAQEVQTEWKQLIDNPDYSRTEYVQSELEDTLNEGLLLDVKSNGVSKGEWHTYKKQHLWKPDVSGQSPLTLWVKTFNGESEYFNLSKPLNVRTRRAIPKSLSTRWKGSNNKNYLGKVVLNEEHVISIFEGLAAKFPDESMIFQVKIIEKPRTPERNKILRTIELYLTAGDESVQINIDKVTVIKKRDDL